MFTFLCGHKTLTKVIDDGGWFISHFFTNILSNFEEPVNFKIIVKYSLKVSPSARNLFTIVRSFDTSGKQVSCATLVAMSLKSRK